MDSTNWTELETALTDAVQKAIKQVGLTTFLSTSLFASNEKKAPAKKAA